MATSVHLTPVNAIAKELRLDHKAALAWLNARGIKPHRTETGPTGRTVRYYKRTVLNEARQYRAERDAAPVAPEPVGDAPSPSPGPQAPQEAAHAADTYMLHLTLQNQHAIMSRLDALAASLAEEHELNEHVRAALDNILEVITRPSAPDGADMSALLGRADDRPGAN